MRAAANGKGDVIDDTWRVAVHEYPLPMVIVDLAELEAIDANDPALKFFTRRDGRPVTGSQEIRLDARHQRLAELLRSGTVDSFEARVTTDPAAGAPMEFHVGVPALDRTASPRHFAVAAVTEGGDVDPTVWPPSARPRV